MREFWDRYGWIVGLVVIVGASLPVFFGRSAFCSADPNEHCGREWIAASSGWLAVFAAFFSVIYLARQIDEANNQHREVLRTEAHAKIALCKRMPMLIGIIEKWLDVLSDETSRPTPPLNALDEFFGTLDALNSALKNPDYAEFDRLFQGDWEGAHQIKTSVTDNLEWNNELRKLRGEFDISQSVENMRAVLRKYERYRKYCTSSREAAAAYVQAWER